MKQMKLHPILDWYALGFIAAISFVSLILVLR